MVKQNEATIMPDNGAEKLRAICEALGISRAALARVSGFSRSYCSRALLGDERCCSPLFLRNIEQNFGQLVDMRTKQLFSLPLVDDADLGKAFR